MKSRVVIATVPSFLWRSEGKVGRRVRIPCSPLHHKQRGPSLSVYIPESVISQIEEMHRRDLPRGLVRLTEGLRKRLAYWVDRYPFEFVATQLQRVDGGAGLSNQDAVSLRVLERLQALEKNKVALTSYLEQIKAIDKESRAEEARLRRELEELRRTTKEKRKRWVEVLAALPPVQ